MIPARERVHDEGGIGMPRNNPWFLITSEEIARIRTQLSILEGEVPENSRRCIDTIVRVINTVEQRLR